MQVLMHKHTATVIVLDYLVEQQIQPAEQHTYADGTSVTFTATPDAAMFSSIG